MGLLRDLTDRLVTAVADQAAADREAELVRRGFVVTRLPGGGVHVHHPATPAVAAAYRARVAANPDELDRVLAAMPATWTASDRPDVPLRPRAHRLA
jgi:hypothetical protein